MANFTAKVGGSLVNVLAGSLNVTNQIGQRSTGSMSVWSNLGVYWQYGTQVQIYDESNALVYAGYTSKDKASRPAGSRQGSGYLLHDLQLMDNSYRADKRRVFKSYLSVTAGYIVNDLLGAYLSAEGVTSTSTSIASGPTITKVIWSGTKSISEALTWLAQQCGYWWQIDLNGVLWFQPYGGTPAPFTLDGTQADAMQDLSVEFGNDMYINRQYTKGSYSETGVLTETFKGDGITRSFTLSYPVGTLQSVTLNNLDITNVVLKKTDTGGFFYYALGDAVLAQDPGFAVLATTDTLAVTYKGRFPVLGMAQNTALVAAQKAREGVGTGIVETVYTDTKVDTLSAAQQIAAARLSHYATDTTLLTFSTRTAGLAPGQMLSVNMSDFGLSNTQMLVNSVTITDGVDGINIWYAVQAVGASPTATTPNAALESAQWQTYWQNLMNQSSDPSDLTDATDTALALFSVSLATTTATVTITQTKVIGAICGVAGAFPPGMICGQWTVC